MTNADPTPPRRAVLVSNRTASERAAARPRRLAAALMLAGWDVALDGPDHRPPLPPRARQPRGRWLPSDTSTANVVLLDTPPDQPAEARRPAATVIRVALLPEPIDELLFSPIDQTTARRVIALPVAGTLAALDADAMDPDTARRAVQTLQAAGIQVCAFGKQSPGTGAAIVVGPVGDDRVLPLIWAGCNAAVAPANSTAAIEAVACGRAVIDPDDPDLAERVRSATPRPPDTTGHTLQDVAAALEHALAANHNATHDDTKATP